MTAKIVSFVRIPKEEPRCSFCGRLKSRVKILIAVTADGPCICSDCVAKATKRLLEEEGDE